uniref:Fatty acid binding protein n=1 Tax=Platynereis dumerilii TaxID=6359 RepID=A0A411F685_PLADU|nr:Fatty acid binding protein [Platynereis dumerilii]
MAPVDFSGKWKTIEYDGMESYLRAMGSPEEVVMKHANWYPVQDIKQTADQFVIDTGILDNRIEVLEFTVGTPFEFVVRGETLTGYTYWEGKKLVLYTYSKQHCKVSKITRQLVGSKIIQTYAYTGSPEEGTRIFAKA